MRRARTQPDLFSTAALASMIPGASPESAVAVGAVTNTVKDMLEGSFAPLWVKGEVSDFKRHRNGHWYFCLRDVTSQLRCVVWSREQRHIPAPPDDGMQVLAFGQVTVYAARGDLQFSVTRMEASGEGLWRKAMELTRLRLAADGLLAAERKRPLPMLPRCVAVVTSPDGAALHDIISVAGRRSPQLSLVVSPTRVQGDGAAEEIVAAIERVVRWGGADVMIVGRGGGAREDLWAFNDERVARAICAAPIPVISAVGHETDITLADLVADLRAATPSVAAEAAVPVRSDLVAELRARSDALVSLARRNVEDARSDATRAARTVGLASSRCVQRQRARAGIASARLHALSPLATLARGYSVARTADDSRTLSSVADFGRGDTFHLRVRDGNVVARVEEVV